MKVASFGLRLGRKLCWVRSLLVQRAPAPAVLAQRPRQRSKAKGPKSMHRRVSHAGKNRLTLGTLGPRKKLQQRESPGYR